MPAPPLWGVAGLKRFVHEHRVGWHETDLAQVVYFANYLTYLEMAELELFRSLGKGEMDWMEEFKMRLPRVEAFCQYKHPARFDDLLEIELAVEVDGKALIFHGDIYRKEDRKLLARGYIKALCTEWDGKRWVKGRELPQDLIDFLKPYTIKREIYGGPP